MLLLSLNNMWGPFFWYHWKRSPGTVGQVEPQLSHNPGKMSEDEWRMNEEKDERRLQINEDKLSCLPAL